jgi:hypothetical protein
MNLFFFEAEKVQATPETFKSLELQYNSWRYKGAANGRV